MHHFIQASNELLRKRGYRLTPQRYMILSVIQEANEHLSVEQITNECRYAILMLASQRSTVHWNS